jgi:cytochrome c biogenesis protein
MTKVLRSVRFNIFLGSILTLACAVGTLVPQTAEMPEKAAQFQASHPQWARLFDFFNFFDIYHAYWFMGLLALMAVDIVLCKLWNAPPDTGLVALPPESTLGEEEAEKELAKKDAALRLKPHQAAFASALAYEQSLDAAKAQLAGAGFHLHDDFRVAKGGAFVATKHRLQRWGSYLAHIGLVVILVGALLKGVFGFVEMVPVLEGRSRQMNSASNWDGFVDYALGHEWGNKHLGFLAKTKTGRDWEVFVDKFTIKYYDRTREPKFFSSDMSVEDHGKELGRKKILVNDPLDIGGVRFYQASWGAGGMFRSITLKLGKEEVQLPQRTPVKIPGTPFKVQADVMMPNFTDNGNGPDTASLDLKNPAVRIAFIMGPHKTRPLWLFENDPELCLVEGDDGQLMRAPKPPFQLAAIDPVLFSGIQVAYDPGFKMVVVGSLLWLLGMIGLFYLNRRRLWVLVEPDGDGSKVSVGGWSSRGAKDYEAEFGRTMDALRAQLSPRSDMELSTRNPLAEV